MRIERPWPANANSYKMQSREGQHSQDEAAVPGMLSAVGRVNGNMHRLKHELSLQGPDHNWLQVLRALRAILKGWQEEGQRSCLL